MLCFSFTPTEEIKSRPSPCALRPVNQLSVVSSKRPNLSCHVADAAGLQMLQALNRGEMLITGRVTTGYITHFQGNIIVVTHRILQSKLQIIFTDCVCLLNMTRLLIKQTNGYSRSNSSGWCIHSNFWVCTCNFPLLQVPIVHTFSELCFFPS